MSKFSSEKLMKIKERKNLTYQEIAEAMKMAPNGVSKLFCGIRSNPQISFLIELADYLKCGVDDFIDYDSDNTLGDNNKNIVRLAEAIAENDTLFKLFKYCKDLSKDELKSLINVVTTFKDQPWIK